MPPVGFEPTISAEGRPQTYALDRAATGTGKKTVCNAQILGSSQPLQERFTCSGILVLLLVHIVSAANETYMGRVSLFPKNTSPCHALPDTLFLQRDHPCSYGHKDVDSALETDDNRSATNSPNITTTNIFFLCFADRASQYNLSN